MLELFIFLLQFIDSRNATDHLDGVANFIIIRI